MGVRMSQLNYAVVTLERSYGGPEEGGWWKDIGYVELLVTVDTNLDFGEEIGEKHINEVWDKAQEVKRAAIALGIREDIETERNIDVVRLYNEYDKRYLQNEDFSHPVHWRPLAEQVCLGQIIPVDCPFYC